ncbi:hypothetical protein V5N11_007419 [Cardamine amara subsp. amara]|uniref:Zinc finger GRF-type domain-containing protein n=1 Tax=Cardamine amara subsp. amara TaxID=228776 RepID=A0ABD1BAY8_CARAN
MSSSTSSGLSSGSGFRGRGGGGDRDKGIPRKCRSGGNCMIKTSETLKNPGRLFYCCTFGSKEDRSHLFK